MIVWGTDWELEQLHEHIGHTIELVKYRGAGDLTFECVDCNAVLVEVVTREQYEGED